MSTTSAWHVRTVSLNDETRGGSRASPYHDVPFEVMHAKTDRSVVEVFAAQTRVAISVATVAIVHTLFHGSR